MKRTLFAAASLALALPTSAVWAQDSAPSATAASALTPEQQTAYDGWPADRKSSYDAWPDTYKSYFWTLSPEQQTGWWALTDEQRGRVYAMTPQQRTAAWAAISAQLSGAGAAPAAAPASPAVDSAAPPPAADTTGQVTSNVAAGNMQFVRNETAQPVASTADTAALASGDLPVCKKGQQDGCINSWEKNRTGNRPLDHWPGKPASEDARPKPQG